MNENHACKLQKNKWINNWNCYLPRGKLRLFLGITCRRHTGNKMQKRSCWIFARDTKCVVFSVVSSAFTHSSRHAGELSWWRVEWMRYRLGSARVYSKNPSIGKSIKALTRQPIRQQASQRSSSRRWGGRSILNQPFKCPVYSLPFLCSRSSLSFLFYCSTP